LSKRSASFRHRVELLQDFSFPTGSNIVKPSLCGEFILAMGHYPPQIKMFELKDMGMKFERRLDALGVDFVFLDGGYGKFAVLRSDRTVEFHAPYGLHYTVRLPVFCRCIEYEKETCRVLCGGVDGNVYRIDVSEGRFIPHLQSTNQGAVNSIKLSPTHRMLVAGGDEGIVNFYDARAGGSVDAMKGLDVKVATKNYGFAVVNDGDVEGVTSCAMSFNGLNLAAGTSQGCVALYDVRSRNELHVKEHQYGLPVSCIEFHEGCGGILSMDEKVIKVWRGAGGGGSSTFADDDEIGVGAVGGGGVGSLICNIPAASPFTHFSLSGDTADPSGKSCGLVLAAGEQSRVQAFFAPSLGPAPQWCSFLEGITEELEEHDNDNEGAGNKEVSVYEDYKFLSREEVEELGISNLIGTPLLRGYMHGFFIDQNLYGSVRSVAKPFEYEEYSKKKIQEKIEQKRASRISPKGVTKKAAVNSDLAERLQEKSKGKKNKKEKDAAKALLADDRFKGLFERDDFAIDEENEDFKLRNPSGVNSKAKLGGNDEDMDSDGEGEVEVDEDENSDGDVAGFAEVETWGKDEEDEDDNIDGEESDSSIEDGFRGAKVRGERYGAMKEMDAKKKRGGSAEKTKQKKKKKPRLLEANDDFGDNAVGLGVGSVSAQKEIKARDAEGDRELGKRIKELRSGGETNGPITRKFGREGAIREYSFVPKAALAEREKRKREKEEKRAKRGGKRGVKDLK